MIVAAREIARQRHFALGLFRLSGAFLVMFGFLAIMQRFSWVQGDKAKAFGLIDEVVTTPCAPPFIEGARLEAAAHGALLLVCCTGGNPAVETAALASLRATRLAGVIYASLVTRAVQPPAALDGLPAVLLNCHAARSASAVSAKLSFA